jgi:hypothetical protein
MLNNPSLTPVDTEEKPISGKVVAADSQEHSDAKKSALTQLSVNNLKLVDKIEEPLQPDPTAVTDNGVVTSAKVNSRPKEINHFFDPCRSSQPLEKPFIV